MKSGNPVRLAIIAGTIAVLLLCGGLWMWVLSPRLAVTPQIQAETEQVELANIALVKREREIQDLAAQAPALAQQAQDLFSRMPQTAELPQVLQQIASAATAAGIPPEDIRLINTSLPQSVEDKTSLSPDAAAAAKSLGVDLAAMTIDISIEGTFDQLMAFLDNLQSLDRAMLITSTSQTAAPAGSKAQDTMNVQGTLFVLESALPDLVANAEQVIAEAQQAAGAPN